MESLIYKLLFAYANKDEDFPHDFEVKALEESVEFLKNSNYNEEEIKFAKKVLLEAKNKLNY